MSLIPILVEKVEKEAKPKGGILGGGTLSDGKLPTHIETQVKHIDTDKLRGSLGTLSTQVSEVLQDIRKVGDFPLKQVQLQVEVSAEGGVTLIGTAKAGIKGAITLTFSTE